MPSASPALPARPPSAAAPRPGRPPINRLAAPPPRPPTTELAACPIAPTASSKKPMVLLSCGRYQSSDPLDGVHLEAQTVLNSACIACGIGDKRDAVAHGIAGL